MLFRLVRPMRRRDSRVPYFVQRIPADIRERAIGQKLHLPVGDETVEFVIRARTTAVKVSLRTDDPVEAKRRQAAVASYVETVWQALRDDAPLPLTYRQATALAGRLYRAWAEGEGRELTVSVTLSMDTRRPIAEQWGIEDAPLAERMGIPRLSSPMPRRSAIFRRALGSAGVILWALLHCWA
jgi:hypothetical protein